MIKLVAWRCAVTCVCEKNAFNTFENLTNLLVNKNKTHTYQFIQDGWTLKTPFVRMSVWKLSCLPKKEGLRGNSPNSQRPTNGPLDLPCPQRIPIEQYGAMPTFCAVYSHYFQNTYSYFIHLGGRGYVLDRNCYALSCITLFPYHLYVFSVSIKHLNRNFRKYASIARSRKVAAALEIVVSSA